MFDDKGNWKEFSFTQDSKHTWFPFWLFCILWAILCYSFTKFLLSSKLNDMNSNNDMKPGYYVLDKKSGKSSKIPKYVYLGPDGEALGMKEGGNEVNIIE